MTQWTGRPVNRCANVQCPNKASEGAFTVVSTADATVGGHRGVTLVLCAPCATALLTDLGDERERA